MTGDEHTVGLQGIIDAAASGQATHYLILTGDYEYHLVNAICVGLRRRGTGMWLTNHASVGAKLLGGARREDEAPQPGPARVGEMLCFDCAGQEFRSKVVLNVEVPRVQATVAAMETISRVLSGRPVRPTPTPPRRKVDVALGTLPLAFVATLVGLLRDAIG